MRRTELLQGLRRMKFEAVLGRWRCQELSQLEAAARALARPAWRHTLSLYAKRLRVEIADIQ